MGRVAGTVNNPLTDSPGVFASGDGGHPHCVLIGNDGLVYVCDRADDRIQVFSKTGVLQRVMAVVPGTGVTLGRRRAGLGHRGLGVGLRLLQRPHADVHVRGRRRQRAGAHHGPPARHDPREFGAAGAPGRPVHVPAHDRQDSNGNLYTGETINGRRVQKFVPVKCNNGDGKGNGNGNCSRAAADARPAARRVRQARRSHPRPTLRADEAPR